MTASLFPQSDAVRRSSLEGFIRSFEMAAPAVRRRGMFPFIAMNIVVPQPVGVIKGWVAFVEAIDRYFQANPYHEFVFETEDPTKVLLRITGAELDVSAAYPLTVSYDRSGRISVVEGLPSLLERPVGRAGIRRLEQKDHAIYRKLRIAALSTEPAAFGADLEVENNHSVSALKDFVKRNKIYAAFVKNEPVGITGLFGYQGAKLRHKAGIFTVFVQPNHRGTGIADQLIAHVIEVARKTPDISLLQLGVGADNAPARRLYERHGFVPFGREPRALNVNGRAIDEILMWLDLEQ